MNGRWSSFVLVCWFFGTPLFATNPPKTPPPYLGEVVLGEGDTLQVRVVYLEQVPFEKQVSRMVDGVERSEQVQLSVPIVQTDSFAVPFSLCLAMTIDGQRMDKAALKKHFAEPKTVLVIDGGKRIDPNYAAVFKPETLVLYIHPEALAQQEPPGQPAPAPVLKLGAKIPPGQVTGRIADAKITLVDYEWRWFPLWEQVEQPGAATSVLQHKVVAEVMSPKKQILEFPVADCVAIGHDGQPATGIDLGARLAESTPILWLREMMKLDTRFWHLHEGAAPNHTPPPEPAPVPPPAPVAPGRPT